MDVRSFDDDGNELIDEEGELVCCKPFPSMPIYFWDDADGSKYHDAYFDVFPNIWRHGDFVTVTKRGGVVMLGRSDATLNPGGVRIGTAEIYRQVEQMEEIDDSVVVGQNWKNDVRVVLFVKLAPGFKLNDELKDKIKQTIRSNASPRHVPAKILSIPDVPYTLNMKKVELAVKKVIQGQPVLNKDALSNPEALEYYENIKELQED
jgi:acetoacetyl-CoA synthetase